MQSWLRDLAGALIFYSIIPLPKGLKPGFRHIARFAPLIGILIGLIQSGIWILLSYFDWPNNSTSLIVIGLGVWITGGIHVDGLMDTFDGIGAGQERCIDAMNDSRIGAIGIQAFCIVLIFQIAALLKLDHMAIVALPISAYFGRCAPLWAMNNFPYLKVNGKSSFHKENFNGAKDSIPSLIILGCILIAIFSVSITFSFRLYLLISIGFGIIFSYVVPKYLGNRLQGHSGDSYGASLILVETLMLLFMGLSLPII